MPQLKHYLSGHTFALLHRVKPLLVMAQEPEAWEILKDCEAISDEYQTRCETAS